MNKFIIDKFGQNYGTLGTETELTTSNGVPLFVGDTVLVTNLLHGQSNQCLIVESFGKFIVFGYGGTGNSLASHKDYTVSLLTSHENADAKSSVFTNDQFTIIDETYDHKAKLKEVFIALEQTSSKEEMIARFNELVGL